MPFWNNAQGRHTIRLLRDFDDTVFMKAHEGALLAEDERKIDAATRSFSNARDFTITGGQFIDAGGVNEINNSYITNVISSGRAVFELLEPYACLEATKDSSARHPPPRCHPGTRLRIQDRLTQWLFNESDERKMLWVRGFAGTGKSAVAQSFGDFCSDAKRHGASYFFSRTTSRNKLDTVVPTIVYQLAITVPGYRPLIEHRLADDPLLLRNSPEVQFRKLIVEPFVTLLHQRPSQSFVIILDGLDECDGEDPQLRILDMINHMMRTNPNLPLRWLIFSRPEAHLKDAFFDLTNCGREELILDAECRDDVERYTREHISRIKHKLRKFVPADWPPEEQMRELLNAVSGLFVLASTCLNYIGDPSEADPRSRLDALLIFMHRSQENVSMNPLAALDLFYSRILEGIPSAIFKTTTRILAHTSYKSQFYELKRLHSAQALCNFLRIDQVAFYKAVRGLHAVMSIPEPEDAAISQLQFHHTSFQDFLLDPNRSGKFVIRKHEALLDIVQSGIYWYEVDVIHFHPCIGWDSELGHKHDSLPGLTWVSKDTRSLLSESITRFLQWGLFNRDFDMVLDGVDEGLLSQLFNIDFRYWQAHNVLNLAIICRLDPLTSLVRTEPSGAMDRQLLEYLNLVIGNGIAKPATFPLRRDLPDGQWIRNYFIIGHGIKSVIVWTTKSPFTRGRVTCSLRSDKEPSDAQISRYQEYLRKFGWDEEKAKLEMK
ncbi:hypothetical protein AGABI2DRAFT_118433 [Agaricus bisporus var. bisporus H97]|uniref:hypothetical protein n=1 Tax=Agaricus bisporus var. bisporus (strain H97 / ATCC MYA-4626 / FGSC 10389) TaxID=936046 RepID=UPI00029F6740|nr:hypothetical protein AGABI2DRAFT_118433 [Agaricus bisporus var. bisporus H97]EKV46231.1 hypothetical protein AGABI2DRAFT_118433 [Agaricus bisporus var. bisporus H97]